MGALDEHPDGQAPVNTVKPDEFRFALRPFEPGDLPFIGESWRRHYSCGSWTRCPGGKDEYIVTQRAVIEQALSTSEVLVAYPVAPEERREQILGWVCYRRPAVLHYIFVKPYYRHDRDVKPEKRLRVGRALVLGALGHGITGTQLPDRIYVTHGWRFPVERSAGISALMLVAARSGITIEYNPALIFGGRP